MADFASFLRSLGPGSPVCCFGPRVAPDRVLAACSRCGGLLARDGRLVVSGGARGCDSAFAAGASAAGGSVRVFRPAPGSGVPGLFARSEAALRFVLASGGGAVIVVPRGAVRGGSLWSLRCAERLRVPVFPWFFDPNQGHYFDGVIQTWKQLQSTKMSNPELSMKKMALASVTAAAWICTAAISYSFAPLTPFALGIALMLSKQR